MRLAGEKASQAKGIASAGADMGGRESGLQRGIVPQSGASKREAPGDNSKEEPHDCTVVNNCRDLGFYTQGDERDRHEQILNRGRYHTICISNNHTGYHDGKKLKGGNSESRKNGQETTEMKKVRDEGVQTKTQQEMG